jgi:hypothetical protein
MTRRLAACAVLLLVVAGAARAQETTDPHQVQPERPTVATHAYTVWSGWVEIEAGLEFDRHPGSARTVGTPTTLKIGLAPRVQLGIAGAWVRNTGIGPAASGVGDLTVDAKWRISDRMPGLGGAFAVLPSLTLPTGSVARGTGAGVTAVGLLLVSSHTLGAVSLDVNAGYTRRSGDGTTAPRDATMWAAAAGLPVHGPVGWAVETYGYPGTGGPAGQRPIVAILTGPTLTPVRWLEVDAGLIIPLTGPQPHALYAGGTWNIGRL